MSALPDGELEMPGDDARLLVVPGGVPGELNDLGGELLHQGGYVDGSSAAHPLGVVALPGQREVSNHPDQKNRRHVPEKPVDPAHGEPFQSSVEVLPMLPAVSTIVLWYYEVTASRITFSRKTLRTPLVSS